jgi:hypothetical protein
MVNTCKHGVFGSAWIPACAGMTLVSGARHHSPGGWKAKTTSTMTGAPQNGLAFQQLDQIQLLVHLAKFSTAAFTVK